ncbi:hypothetical protein MHH28_30100 [Paenibacillus sp. FSL K6-1217]|uniref:hypothetical protein n=1 Tax=Paenibacillus sp. FSL K6-1217 TaxID=2921466 RepID=UPI00324D3522
MKTRGILQVLAVFLLLAAVITLHDVMENQLLRILLTLAIAVAAAYGVSKSSLQKQVSGRTMTIGVVSLLVFTCMYHVLLSVALKQSVFANDFWIFMCVIYLLVWMRARLSPSR